MDAFKQNMGDLLYYLSSRKTEVFREAAVPFVKKYIQLPEVWDTPQDRAQVVSLGELLLDLCSRTPVGSAVPDLRVLGVLRRKPGLFVAGSRSGEFALRKLKGSPAYVVFYSAQCSSCQEMLEAVERLVLENRRARLLMVDMDGLMTDAPETGQLLLDTFDLSALPMVLELDKKDVAIPAQYMKTAVEITRHGDDSVPEYMIWLQKGDFTGRYTLRKGRHNAITQITWAERGYQVRHYIC